MNVSQIIEKFTTEIQYGIQKKKAAPFLETASHENKDETD